VDSQVREDLTVKKVARLEWIHDRFGEEYIQPYQMCRTFRELHIACTSFQHGNGWEWGLRTDLRNGTEQGFNLPFLYKGNITAAMKIWERYGERLVYIVTKHLPAVRLNAVAIPVGPEHVFIEWNERERKIAQRNMYDNPKNVRRSIFGSGSEVYWNGSMRRVFNPRHASWWRFDEVYRLALSTASVDEITFSVTPDGKVVIW
jgi:hypothetical protein